MYTAEGFVYVTAVLIIRVLLIVDCENTLFERRV